MVCKGTTPDPFILTTLPVCQELAHRPVDPQTRRPEDWQRHIPMQNIPGLSFFDGLTRSRNPGHGRASSSAATSPPSTPLQDAATLRGVMGNDPQSIGGTNTNRPTGEGEHKELAETLDDPLSSSLMSNASSSSPLPAASFSRRAATVSSGSFSSISPMPGLGRRATNSSSSSRSSILSGDSIFSTPILGRRPSAAADSVHGGAGGRNRSGSTASRESEEPTAKDVGLMAQGTQAYTLLKRIQEHPIELADIIRMLVTKKVWGMGSYLPRHKRVSYPFRSPIRSCGCVPRSTSPMVLVLQCF